MQQNNFPINFKNFICPTELIFCQFWYLTNYVLPVFIVAFMLEDSVFSSYIRGLFMESRHHSWSFNLRYHLLSGPGMSSPGIIYTVRWSFPGRDYLRACSINVIRYQPLNLSWGILTYPNSFFDFYSWYETVNLLHVNSCEMLPFVTSYMSQNKFFRVPITCWILPLKNKRWNLQFWVFLKINIYSCNFLHVLHF